MMTDGGDDIISEPNKQNANNTTQKHQRKKTRPLNARYMHKKMARYLPVPIKSQLLVQRQFLFLRFGKLNANSTSATAPTALYNPTSIYRAREKQSQISIHLKFDALNAFLEPRERDLQDQCCRIGRVDSCPSRLVTDRGKPVKESVDALEG
jgi:hypothetical protein